jgi:hypothetical protein
LKYVTLINNQQQILEPYEVFCIQGFSTNGLTGVPLVRLMSETLGLTKAEEQFAAAYFGNGAHGGGVVEVAGVLDDAAKKNLRDGFQSSHGGLGNAFRTIFLEEGMTYEPYEFDAEKAQLVNSRQYQLGDLARVTGLSPHLLFDLSRATFSNIEQLGIEAVTYSFRPWGNKLCGEANRKLLYESEKGVFEAVIDLKPLMMGDAKTQAERDQIRFNCAALTPNEIREMDGRNPIEGGDQLFLNVATMPLSLTMQKALTDIAVAQAGTQTPAEAAAESEGQDTDPEPTDDNPPPQGDATYDDGPKVNPSEVEDVNEITTPTRALLPVVEDVVKRIMRREAKAVRSALAKHAGDSEALKQWEYTHQDETRLHVAEVLTPISETLRQMSTTVDIDTITETFITRTTTDLNTLASSKDKPADINLMIEGWIQERTQNMVKDIMGE